MLLCRDRDVAERLAVVGVGQRRERHHIGDDAPTHVLLVTLRQVFLHERPQLADDRAPFAGQRREIFGDRRRLSLERCHYHNPTFPLTEAISFAGSKPTPCLNTVSTLRTSAMVFEGSPSMTTRSSCLPPAIDPTRAVLPR